MFEALRWRLTAWYVLVFVAVFAVVGVTVFLWANSRFSGDVDAAIREVSDEASHQAVQYEDIRQSEGDVRDVLVTTNLSGSADVFVLLLDPAGAIAANPSDVPTEGLPDGASVQRAKLAGSDWGRFRVGENDLRVRTVAVRRNGNLLGYVQAGKSVEEWEHSLQTLTIVMAGGAVMGLVLATAGGILVATIAMRPVKRAYERQREFVADASHELRTPLAVIRVNAEASSARDEAVSDIAAEASYMTRLLDDLLLLAGSDREGIDLHPERIDLAEVARSAARGAAPLAAAAGLEFTVRVDDVLPADADAERCREVLLILLDNAVKYTPKGGSVALHAFASGSDAVVTVSDTGIGLALEERERVFDRFCRVDKARSRAAGGTGLGLSIAREIVDAHRGSLRLESQPKAGTTVTMRLPLARLRPTGSQS